jgi:hypothetical protein
MRKIPVRLTDTELQTLWDLAEKRNSNKESHGVRTKKIDTQVSDLEMHYIGMKAEYAASKLIGADFNPENMLAGDNGVDFIYRGLTVDVKLSQMDLKFRPGTFLADIAILVQPLMTGTWRYGGKEITAEPDARVNKRRFAWRNMLVVGWVAREEHEKEHTIRNFGYNDVEFMEVKDLSPLVDLLKYAQWRNEADNMHP